MASVRSTRYKGVFCEGVVLGVLFGMQGDFFGVGVPSASILLRVGYHDEARRVVWGWVRVSG